MKTFLEKHCTAEWYEFIKFHMKVITFKKGEYIFKCDEETKGLYIIDKGKVKISYMQHNGSQRLIRLAGDGDVLGHRGFGGNWKYPISAYTLEKTIVDFLPIELFNVLAKTNTEFVYNLMMFYADELRHSDLKIRALPIRNLLAEALYNNLSTFGYEEGSTTKLSYSLSRADIASYVDTSYETIVRKLAEFNKEGIIKIEGKSIHILDEEKLKSLVISKYKIKKEDPN